MPNLQLLYEYFPELYKPDLKKTHQKQWDKFLNAFQELVLWIHSTRARHKNGNGIVLFPSWWERHLKNYQRWHFNIEQELQPYLITDGSYNFSQNLSREWIPTENFKQRSIALISDTRFVGNKMWHSIIETIITTTDETKTNIGHIKLEIPVIPADLNTESYLIVLAYIDKLKQGIPITYTVSNTGRLHNPLQNIKRYYRNLLFDGWYSYDFQVCAPSILAQEYYRLVPNKSLPAIQLFINNREEIRKEIALHTGIPEITIKKALTGLFFGQTIPTDKQARWDISTTNAFDKFKFSLINSLGPVVTEILLANPIFIDIVQECTSKVMKELSFFLKEQSITENDIWKLTNKCGAVKEMSRWNTRQAIAHWYFGWERILIDIVNNYIQQEYPSAQFLLIHDGWLCNQQIDIIKLKSIIKEQTGFDLSINEDKIYQEKRHS